MEAALGNRREVFAAAHAVELDDFADDLLLDERELNAAARKAHEGGLELFEVLDALTVVRAERVEVAALDVHGGGQVDGAQRLQVEGGGGADEDTFGHGHPGAHQAGAEQVAIAVADGEGGIDDDGAGLFGGGEA